MAKNGETTEPTMLGIWLKQCRGARSQTEVAARIEMDQAEWSKWETGKRRHPKPKQIRDFALAVGTPVASVALAYVGIWPEGEMVTEPSDDPIALMDQISALHDRLARIVRDQPPRATLALPARSVGPGPTSSDST